MLSDAGTDILAGLVVGLYALGLAAWGSLVYYRNTYSLVLYPFYLLNLVMTRIMWRTEIRGQLDVGSGQGAVIICNHRSPIDPAFVALASDRLIHWMVAREYCVDPLLGWILRTLQVIPVSRGGVDTAATKLAVRYAQQGELVGLFPEGRINETQELLLPGRPGVALIALKANVPVIPCYLEGAPYDGTTMGWFVMTAHARLTIGRPIDLAPFRARADEKDILEQVTKHLLVQIAELGGVKDFSPRIAGRRWKPEEIDVD